MVSYFNNVPTAQAKVEPAEKTDSLKMTPLGAKLYDMTMCDRLRWPLRNWKNVGMFIIEIHIGPTAYFFFLIES